jgi:cell division septum initiation protein DivIVA
MSLSQSFFPSENEEIQHPQFTRALKGFNVGEVESYVIQSKRRIEVLEEHLDKALDDRDHLRRELASVKSDVYRSAGERLAGILRSIDDHVEGIRRNAEEDAARRIVEAERQAEALKREAEEAGARTRAEAARILHEATEESERVLGALAGRRDELKAEIESLRAVLRSLLDRLVVPADEPMERPPATDLDAPATDLDAQPTDLDAQPTDLDALAGEAAPSAATDGTASEPGPAGEESQEPDWAAEIDEAVVDLRGISVNDEGSDSGMS